MSNMFLRHKQKHAGHRLLVRSVLMGQEVLSMHCLPWKWRKRTCNQLQLEWIDWCGTLADQQHWLGTVQWRKGAMRSKGELGMCSQTVPMGRKQFQALGDTHCLRMLIFVNCLFAESWSGTYSLFVNHQSRSKNQDIVKLTLTHRYKKIHLRQIHPPIHSTNFPSKNQD